MESSADTSGAFTRDARKPLPLWGRRIGGRPHVYRTDRQAFGVRGGFTRHACAPHLLSLKTDFGHATLNSPRVFSTHSPPGGPRRNTLDAFPANGSQDTLPERTLTHAHTHPARSKLLAFVRLKIHTSADISGIVYARHMDTHSAHI